MTNLSDRHPITTLFLIYPSQPLIFFLPKFEESQNDDNQIGAMKPHMDDITCVHPNMNNFIQFYDLENFDNFIHEK